MMAFRLAGHDDLPAISRLANPNDAVWSERAWRDALDSGYDVHLMFDDSILSGAAALQHCLDETELLEIVIAGQLRGKGLGRQLMEHLLHVARSGGATRMLLEVRESNLPARALYESLGFTQNGLRKNYYPCENGREHAVLMEKNT